MKCVTVVGARPQFIKAAPVSIALKAAGIEQKLLHTGQHFDAGMSAVFFEELGIPRPDYHFAHGGLSHGAMTGAMLADVEAVIVNEAPDLVLVYGDTNSTLAGALAAAKLNIPVAHVEAGLRSFNMRMPEEVNRVLTDRISSLLFCSSEVGREHLAREGINRGVFVVGDVMADSLAMVARERSRLSDRAATYFNGAIPDGFVLMTVHRAENTDNIERLGEILRGIEAAARPVIWPIHPRTRAALAAREFAVPRNIRLIDPVGYFDMAALLFACAVVLTDSGGLQKEAYWAQRPCLTAREETEWTETVEAGWNVIVGHDASKIAGFLNAPPRSSRHPELYGDGHAAERIVEILREEMSR